MGISKRSILYHVSILSLSGVFLQAAGFVYQILLSRLAGAEALGMFHLVMPVYSVMVAATITGTRLAMTSLSAGLPCKNRRADVQALVKRGCGAFLFLFAATAVPVYLLRDFIAGRIIGEPRTALALVLILACIFLSGFEGIFESLFMGIGKTQYTAISNMLEQVAKIFLILFLLTRFRREGEPSRICFLLAIGMTLCEIPVLIWLLFIYRRTNGRRREEGKEKGKAPAVLPVALPVSCSAVVTNLIASASALLLPQRLQRAGMSGPQALSALGVVSEMALPLITLPMVLVRSLSNVLMPVISQSSAQGQQANVKRKIQKSFQATGLVVLPATAILAPLCMPLARILFHQQLDEVYILILAAAAIATYFEMISASILNGLNRQKAGMLCMIAGEGVQLFCTFFLAALPKMNIYGYMLGMLLSPLTVLLLNLWIIRRSTGFAPRLIESFIIPLLVSGAAGGFTRWFYLHFVRLFPGEGPAVLFAAAAGCGICLLLFLLTGLRPLRYYQTLQEDKQKNALRREKKLV